MTEAAFLNVLDLFATIAKTALAIRSYIVSAGAVAEQQYQRKQLLSAYQVRRRWKKSDARRLKQLGASPAALRRVAKTKTLGRPIVRKAHSLQEILCTRYLELRPLFDPDSSKEARQKSFKLWPWYKHHVEALYRGEQRAIRESGTRSPAATAREKVGKSLGISEDAVHAICQAVRNERKLFPEEDGFPEITLSDHAIWMETGRRPYYDTY